MLGREIPDVGYGVHVVLAKYIQLAGLLDAAVVMRVLPHGFDSQSITNTASQPLTFVGRTNYFSFVIEVI
jgi:hypothetical protein